jgi:hypothetical protein
MAEDGAQCRHRPSAPEEAALLEARQALRNAAPERTVQTRRASTWRAPTRCYAPSRSDFI